ncbi:MAG: Uma2 family endonuclease [Bacteroidota bacterium]
MTAITTAPTKAIEEKGSGQSEAQVYSIAEYLAIEIEAEVRHEFDNGIITEMAGGTIPHNLVKGRFFSKLDRYTEDNDLPNLVLNSDTKVWLEQKQRFVYPDITVTAGKPVYYNTPEGKIRRDIITNPLLVVEVLSPETRNKDKAEKFEDYCSIPTFREYILIEPEMTWVKSLYFQDVEDELWKIQTFQELEDNLPLYSLDMNLKLEDIYAVLEKLE